MKIYLCCFPEHEKKTVISDNTFQEFFHAMRKCGLHYQKEKCCLGNIFSTPDCRQSEMSTRPSRLFHIFKQIFANKLFIEYLHYTSNN
jgi:hypothetical protein